MSKHPTNRRGYALLLVMMFVVLFGAVLGVAWRRVGSALRIEHVSEMRKQSDRGSIQVLAQAMKMLETRLRLNGDGEAQLDVSNTPTPDYRTSYTFRSREPYDVSSDPATPDSRWYVIQFERQGDGQWLVNVSSTKDQPGYPEMPLSPP